MLTCSLHADIHHGLLFTCIYYTSSLLQGPQRRTVQVSHYSLSFQLKNLEQYSESWRPSIHNSLTCSVTAVQASLTHKSWNSSALSLMSNQPESLSSTLACAHSRIRLRSPSTELVCTHSPSFRERLWGVMLHSSWYMTHGTDFHTQRKQGVIRGLKRKQFVSLKTNTMLLCTQNINSNHKSQ